MKKYFMMIALFFLTFIVSISSVNAATKNIEVLDVKVQDKNSTITVDNVVLKDNTVTSNITFNKVNDYVVFELTLKNNEEDKYKIISVEDNNKNSNISTSYTFDKDYMGKGKTSSVKIKIEYDNELTNQEKISLNNLNIKINLEREDGSKQEIIINPTTGDSILRYLLLGIFSLFGIILTVLKKKQKIGTALLVLVTILIPFSAIANEKYEINLKFTNIDIKGTTVAPEPEVPDYATLIEGQEINRLLSDEATGEFRKATEEEYNSIKDTLTNDNIISTEDSPIPVYMWKSGVDTLYYSEAGTIYMNPDSSHMFEISHFTSVDLSELDSSKVTNMEKMFADCALLETIYVSDKWDTSSVTNSLHMFENDVKLFGEKGTMYNSSNPDDVTYAHVDEGSTNPGYLTLKGHEKTVPDTVLLEGSVFNSKLASIASTQKNFRQATEEEYNSVKDSLNDDNVISGDMQPKAYLWATTDDVLYYSKSNKIYMNENSSHLFANTSFETIDLSGLDSSKVTNMSSFFEGCSSLTSIIYENTNNSTSNQNLSANMYENFIGNIIGIFIIAFTIICLIISIVIYNAYKKSNRIQVPVALVFALVLAISAGILLEGYNLKGVLALVTGNQNNSKTSNFDTSKVINMSSMFKDCSSLTSIDLSPLNTGNVTDMSSMFKNCSSLENIDLSSLNTENVTNMSSMFSECSSLVELDITPLDTSKVEQMYDMFQYCSSLETIYVDENWTFELYKDYGCNYTTYIDSVVGAGGMFEGCDKLVGEKGTSYEGEYDIYYGDYRSYDGHYAVIDRGPLAPGYFTTKGHTKDSVQNYSVLLPGYRIEEKLWNLHNYDYSYENFRPATEEEYNTVKDSLTDDNVVSHYNAAKTYIWADKNNDTLYYSETGKIYMDIDSTYMFAMSPYKSIDLSGFDSSSALSLSGMFENCSWLEEIIFGDDFDTSNVMGMEYMFYNCSSLVELDLSSFDTRSVVDMSGMFKDCSSLEKLNLSSFDTSNVTDINYMFEYCSSLVELDLSSFDTSKIYYIEDVFSSDYNLETIYVSDLWETNFDGRYVFYNCTSLVGGAGTTFDPDHDDHEYAHVDGGPSNPGYFTHINDKPHN